MALGIQGCLGKRKILWITIPTSVLCFILCDIGVSLSLCCPGNGARSLGGSVVEGVREACDLNAPVT